MNIATRLLLANCLAFLATIVAEASPANAQNVPEELAFEHALRGQVGRDRVRTLTNQTQNPAIEIPLGLAKFVWVQLLRRNEANTRVALRAVLRDSLLPN
jgi:hypothetical protein